MRQNNVADMTICEQLEAIKADICDNKCRMTQEYLSQYKDPDEAYQKMLADACHFCGMSRL